MADLPDLDAIAAHVDLKAEIERLREDATIVLDACDVPNVYDDGTVPTLSDRLRDLGMRYRHAKLLAAIAGMKLKGDTTAAPTKNGDKMPLALAWTCRHFAEQIEAVPEAKNYLAFGWTDEATGKGYNVTIQRAEGKSPQTIAAEAIEEAATLRAENAALVARVRELEQDVIRAREEASLTQGEGAARIRSLIAVARKIDRPMLAGRDYAEAWSELHDALAALDAATGRKA